MGISIGAVLAHGFGLFVFLVIVLGAFCSALSKM